MLLHQILKYYNHVKSALEQKRVEHREKQQQLLQEQQQKQQLMQQSQQQAQTRIPQHGMPYQPPPAQSGSSIPLQRPPTATYANSAVPISMQQQPQFRPQFPPNASAQLKDPFKTAGGVAYIPPTSYTSGGMHQQYHNGPHLINQNISYGIILAMLFVVFL